MRLVLLRPLGRRRAAGAALLTLLAVAGIVQLDRPSAAPARAAAPLVTSTLAPVEPSPEPSPSVVAPSPSPSAKPSPAPSPVVVAPLRARVPTDVMVTASQPLDPALVRRLVAATRARAALPLASGQVRLGAGRTTAIGVDPSTFRAWTAKGTADSDGVWRSVAQGEGSVAHAVARAFAVRLGGSVTAARASRSARLRVGSFATTGLPGVGLVVDNARGRELGLVQGSALLLSAPQVDPVVTAAYAKDLVGGTAQVLPVAVDRVALGRWVAPVAGQVTSLFGPRLAPLPGASTFHEGLDIAAPLGTPVYAMSDGEVLYAGPAQGFGQEIVLSHRGGITTVYGHMSRLLVSGGPVTAGQPIALVGNEGESTGPHLHVEVRVDDRPVDPLAWLRAHGVPVG